MTLYRSIGIMSGTSGDGIDAVLLEFDGIYRPHRPRLIAAAQKPFSPELSQEIVHARSLSIARLTELSFALPRLYADTVRQLPDWQTADCIGVHGQTVTHQVQAAPPAPRGTWQIGSTAVLAQELHLPVVGDLRAMDVALGGQGAPIVPLAHWFFLAEHTSGCVVVNLGGICNASIVTQAMHEVTGFDVGPGMMISDAFAKQCTQGRLSCDLDGQLSRGGKRIPALYQAMLAHPFVARPTPKSAGREEFGAAYYEPLLAQFAPSYAPADIMYTLLCATTDILAQTIAPYLQAPKLSRLVLTGGGARNPVLQALMAEAFAPLPVVVETTGVMAPQNHEPAAMALIGLRTLHRLPSALPRVTGASYGAVLGHITWPTPIAARVRPMRASQDLVSARRARIVAASEHAASHILDAGVATAVSVHVLERGACLTAVTRGDAQRYQWHDATQTVAATPSPRPLSATCPFDLASLTKVLATTAAIMALISDGRLALHARAATFLPSLAGTDKAEITIDQLLRHRAGLAPWGPLYLSAHGIDAVVHRIASLPLRDAPGRRRIYSDLGYILLGAIVAAIDHQPLDAYVARRITQPLGLNHLVFAPGDAMRRRCVATAHSNAYERRMIDDAQFGHTFFGKGDVDSASFAAWRNRTMCGEVNDANAYHALDGVAGHAGLFGTGEEVAALAAEMTSGDKQIFAPEVVRDFLIAAHGTDLMGWANPTTWPSLIDARVALGELGCVVSEGFTGGLIACFPVAGLTAVMLTNRQHQLHADAVLPPSLDAFRQPLILALADYAMG